MATLAGKIIDGDTGEQVPARVRVLASNGEFVHPGDAILKVGPGDHFFYADGGFEVEVGRGRTQIVVEREMGCLECHQELAPYRESEHQVNPRMLTRSCVFCHVAREIKKP